MDWLGNLIQQAFWTALLGWTGLVPLEVWIVLGGIVVLLVLRKLGWPGVAGLAAVVGYLAGVKRARESYGELDHDPQQPRPPEPAPRPQRPGLFRDLFKRRQK